MRQSKGLADVVRLIEADGREVHCLDLAGAGVEESSTGPVLDDTARRQYERRIRELQEEIDEAEMNNDLGRAYKSQVELDALIDHLTAALGVGNKTRSAGGTTERARSAVTHRIRATIRQMEKVNPNLGPTPAPRHQHRHVLQLPPRAPDHLADAAGDQWVISPRRRITLSTRPYSWRLLGGEPAVALGVGLDLLERLPGVLGDQLGHAPLGVGELLGLDGDVGGLAAQAGERLVHHDPGVRAACSACRRRRR